MIVIVFGLPGSGKSYFAERLAKVLDSVYLSSDRVRKEVLKEKDYSLKAKRMVYKRMIERGKEALRTGQTVVFDGTFFLKSIREMFCKNFNHHSTIHYIEVLASKTLIKERTTKKRIDSDADYEIHKKIKRAFQPMSGPHLKLISTDKNLSEMIGSALKHLRLKERNDTKRYTFTA